MKGFEVRFLMIHLRDDPGFSIMGEMEERQRPHMAPDDIAFDRSQMVTDFGVMQTPGRMPKTMEPVAFMAFVPVIKIIVMKKGASDQGTVIDLQVSFPSVVIGKHRHR